MTEKMMNARKKKCAMFMNVRQFKFYKTNGRTGNSVENWSCQSIYNLA